MKFLFRFSCLWDISEPRRINHYFCNLLSSVTFILELWYLWYHCLIVSIILMRLIDLPLCPICAGSTTPLAKKTVKSHLVLWWAIWLWKTKWRSKNFKIWSLEWFSILLAQSSFLYLSHCKNTPNPRKLGILMSYLRTNLL
jgi:hypothetical protein